MSTTVETRREVSVYPRPTVAPAADSGTDGASRGVDPECQDGAVPDLDTRAPSPTRDGSCSSRSLSCREVGRL